MSETIIAVGGDDIEHILPMSQAIEAVAAAMIRLSSAEVQAPPRLYTPLDSGGGIGLMFGSMPTRARAGVKVSSIFPATMRQGLPNHQGVVVMFATENGRPLLICEGRVLTSVRTAAASAVATRALAREDASTLTLLGCGEQASRHLEAIALVRPIREVRIWGRSPDRVAVFIAGHRRADGPLLVAATSVQQAVEGADIVCTLTGSGEPILRGNWLADGQHVNLVGASTRASREADDDVVRYARYFVDSRVHALEHAGELRHAMAAGLVDDAHIVGEIGHVLLGEVRGRLNDNDRTVYKSLGHIAQDIAASEALLDAATKTERGTRLNW